MSIEVLGPVRLSTDVGTPVEVPERKVRLLLAALVVAGGEAVPADALIERVWGDRLPAYPERVLRAKLSLLRVALDQAMPGMRECLTHGPGGYTLAVDHGEVDAERFTTAVAQARGITSAAERAEALGEALSQWRGRAFADVADELWLGPAIESLHEARLRAIEQRAEALLESGAPAAALDLVHGELAEHPSRERLVGARMLALYRLGRQDEALRAYESLRRRLAEELGADPWSALRELHARILRHDPALSPTTEPSSKHGNLPAMATTLIGRGQESERIADLLAAGRLVTLTGVGGVGKTRLALHVAHAVADRFERGVWWIDLTQLAASGPGSGPESGERVAQLTVTALGLPDDGTPGSSVSRLARTVGEKETLVVLDNAEHVIAETSVFAAELLRRASGARLLVTSRQTSALPEEQRFEVGALSTSAADDGPSDTARFFLARARAADPDFEPDETSMATIEELGRRLDGLPLALELAASRVRGVSVEDLTERLSDRLNLLSRPGHGVPRRQQTLRGMIDWSWSLLDERERTVLRRLAVHPGSWNLAAVEAVCADDPDEDAHSIAAGEVVDVLIGLVDRSMVATISTPGGGLRYRLLESIGLYAAERLAEAGERDVVARRHRQHFRALVEREDARLRGPKQRSALTVLDAERVHIDQAFDEALAAGDGGMAVGIAVSGFWHRWMTGRRARLRDRLTAAIAAAGPCESAYASAVTLRTSLHLDEHSGGEEAAIRSALESFGSDELARARVQWFAATALMAVGVREAGEALSDEAIEILHRHGDIWHVLAATCERNWFLVTRWMQPPRSLPDGRAPEVVAGEVGDPYLEAQAVGVLQRVAEHAAEYERAATLAEDALRLCRGLGFYSEGAWWAVCSAIGAIRRGEVDEAWSRLATARAMSGEVGDEAGQAHADYAEAILVRSDGGAARARTLLDRWRRAEASLHETATDSVGDPGVRIEHAYLAIEEDDLDSAGRVVRGLIPLLEHGDRPRLTSRWLELGSALRLAQHDGRSAAWLLELADAHRARTGSPRDAVDEIDVARLRRSLGVGREEPVRRNRTSRSEELGEAFASFA